MCGFESGQVQTLFNQTSNDKMLVILGDDIGSTRATIGVEMCYYKASCEMLGRMI